MPAPLVAPAAPSCPRGGPYPPGAGAGAHSTPPGRAPRRPARPEEPSTLWGAAARSPGPLPTPRRLCGSARAPTRVPAAPAPATLSRGPHAPPPAPPAFPSRGPGHPRGARGLRWGGGEVARPPANLPAASELREQRRCGAKRGHVCARRTQPAGTRPSPGRTEGVRPALGLRGQGLRPNTSTRVRIIKAFI